MNLKEYFQQQYQGYESFLENVIFPIFGEENFEDGFEEDILANNPQYITEARNTGIKSIIRVGNITIDPFNPTSIFDIRVGDHTQLARNRVGVQHLIRRMMDTFSSAFMIFHYDDATVWDWRFSFCRKGNGNDDSTESKRYTFLLGPNQSCRTAAENFEKLLAKGGSIDTADIVKAFDVEALSDEFFARYKEQYEKFVEYITGTHFVKKAGKWEETKKREPHPQMYNDFGRDNKKVRDYIKKLLGRIVFLHFLQKKGWLGDGDPQFMLHLYERATEAEKDDFLDSVLEPLFHGVLNTKKDDRRKVFIENGWNTALLHGWQDMPYLNGGLFERDSLDEIPTRFPREMFSELLQFFYQYNFTIDENDPNDAQVGVDPEMLGRIFENLLEDNKDKGAYYTPKEIVRYMCRQSLTAYLQTDIADEAQREAIAEFVRTYDVALLGGSGSDFARKIDHRLKEVKICDPAIGSGAFPMGLLRELFLCRGAIENFSDAAGIKRHIIQQNIYGVDIERGAVDIARLRFWLSLIVDEEEPQALPNLDYKIMQGNSLLEQYKGFDMSGIALSDPNGTIVFDDETCNRALIQEHIRKYFDTDNHTERQLLRLNISDAVKALIRNNGTSLSDEELSALNIQSNPHFFLWHTWFSDVLNRPSPCNGFDIVIGNPPYGAKQGREEKDYCKKHYITAKTIKGVQKGSIDTYTLFIELAYNLLSKGGCMTMIVPIAVTSSDSSSGVHHLLMQYCDEINVSSYAVRPQPVFKNAVVNTSIISFRKTLAPCTSLCATKMYRKGKNFNLQSLVDNLQFVDVKDCLLFGRIPKISESIEHRILQKISSLPKLGSYIREQGAPIYYRTTGGRYFKVVTDYTTGSTKETSVILNSKYAKSIGCLLSSNFSFWFYQIYSNNLDWRTPEIESFPIPSLTDETITELEHLYSEYLADIERNANTRITSGESSYKVSSFKEYKIGKSKPIIDRIDDIICPLYGLTQEETDFIKNYEIEFRLSDGE